MRPDLDRHAEQLYLRVYTELGTILAFNINFNEYHGRVEAT